jgi:hypothetical protein
MTKVNADNYINTFLCRKLNPSYSTWNMRGMYEGNITQKFATRLNSVFSTAVAK